jgi:DNA transformation protein and related proteins
MADPQGTRLYVNCSAAQARRRLEGFGHGVRKIHSAGAGRAVIIHTATGQHLEELQQQFAAVGYASSERGLDESTE